MSSLRSFGSTPARAPNKNGQKSQSTTLVAVALQDHLMRSLSLTNPERPRRVPQPRSSLKKPVRSVIDTGRGKNLNKKQQPLEQREYVLDPKPPVPTLAQKLGLVDGDTEALTEDEWKNAKHQSNQREDFKQPCVICKEDFGFQEQVLLSCTHVFHRACLQAFERFTGRKTCPMCRKEQYQTRVIHEGAKYHKVKCATRIQAAWRGYVVRRWYLKLRQTVPPKDPKLRKKFYEEKLHSITDRMIRSCDHNINAFLSEIDRNLEASRDVFRHFDNVNKILTEDDWDEIQLKAVQRGVVECPICLCTLECNDTFQGDTPRQEQIMLHSDKNNISKHATNTVHEAKSVESKLNKDTNQRKSVLLSCSHVFHQTCLQTFEQLVIEEHRHVCPVCRTVYQKHVL